MKRSHFFLVVTALLLAGRVPAEDRSWDFEDGTPQNWRNWGTVQNDEMRAKSKNITTITTENPAQGTRAMIFRDDMTTLNPYMLAAPIQVKSTSRYVFGGKIRRLHQPGTVMVDFEWSRDGKPQSWIERNRFEVGTAWQDFEVPLNTLPGGATSVRPAIFPHAGNSPADTGAIAVDALYFKEIPADTHDVFPDHQTELCMIGDSITWYGEGDHFRRQLLRHMPELAFVGTHTAKFGYSHAGEGGNSTPHILKRLNAIPPARNYHLLAGVNDSAAARSADQVDAVAAGTAERLIQIAEALAARPETERVFLGTIFPCVPDGRPDATDYQFRDAAAARTNELLRQRFSTDVPAGKIILVEYEKPLRALPDWKKIIRLHPTPAGYVHVAAILAESLRRHAVASPGKIDRAACGVEVTNFIDPATGLCRPVLPGWYTVSFQVEKMDDRELTFKIGKQSFSLALQPGDRGQVEYFTGYIGMARPLEISFENGTVSHLMVEKTRPSRQASVYGEGTFIDTVSPMRLGEKLVPISGK